MAGLILEDKLKFSKKLISCNEVLQELLPLNEPLISLITFNYCGGGGGGVTKYRHVYPGPIRNSCLIPFPSRNMIKKTGPQATRLDIERSPPAPVEPHRTLVVDDLTTRTV